MIQWQESYSTGVAKLDEQHKSLFDYCNELEEGIKTGDISKTTLELALRFLERYAKGHFGQEETCMFRFQCPIGDKNKAAHQEFINTFQTFQKTIIEDTEFEKNLKELHHFLENWLVNHICKIDTQLKPCVH